MKNENEITINGVVYVRKDIAAKKEQENKFKKGCQYFTYLSCNPSAKIKELQKCLPEMNVFFVGKKGYCGKVCLEVDIRDMTVDFFKRILPVNDFFSIIEDEKTFNDMVDEEMKKPDLH